MSKILEIKATEWKREDLPGYHVRYTLPDDAEISVGGPNVTVYADGTISNRGAVGNVVAPVLGSYESEVAQALLGHWTTDAQGRLVDHRTGKVTEATPDDPWPATVDSVEALLQFQFDHNNRPDQIYVDGVKFGQAGIDPGVRYSSATGKLTLEFSPPIAQKIDLPAITATATDPQRVTVAPPAGHQTTLTLHGPTIVTLTDLQAPTVPGRMAFVRLTDKAGQQMPTGSVDVLVGDVEVYSALANGFDCQIAVGANVPGAQVNVPDGTSLRVEALGLSSDVLMDYRSANWG